MFCERINKENPGKQGRISDFSSLLKRIIFLKKQLFCLMKSLLKNIKLLPNTKQQILNP